LLHVFDNLHPAAGEKVEHVRVRAGKTTVRLVYYEALSANIFLHLREVAPVLPQSTTSACNVMFYVK
jgi:hypothetical protein